MSTTHKAKTVNELIEYLQSWADKDQLVAYTVYTKEDIEGDEDYYEFPSLTEAWNTVVDEVQADLEEGYHVEVFAEAIREITERHFEYKGD